MFPFQRAWLSISHYYLSVNAKARWPPRDDLPTNDSYADQRAALIAKDRALRMDSSRKYTDLLGGQKQKLYRADDIIRKIRTTEVDTVWSKLSDDVPRLFPGMEFLTGE